MSRRGIPVVITTRQVEGKKTDTKVESLPKCPVCENSYSPGAKFCHSCGAYLKYFHENLNEK